jgi:hypothetical protein
MGWLVVVDGAHAQEGWETNEDGQRWFLMTKAVASVAEMLALMV